MPQPLQITVPDEVLRVAERRERMRLRLQGTAIRIGAEKGPAAISIDDVVVGAEVSRGSFYKDFPSTDALLREVATEIANELIRMAEAVVIDADEARQISTRRLRAVVQPASGIFAKSVALAA